MVVASLLYAVCLYRAYGTLDTLSPYRYYKLLAKPSAIFVTRLSSRAVYFHINEVAVL